MKKKPTVTSTRTIRIYFMGASGVGKTTLAKWAEVQFGLPILPSATAKALEEMKGSDYDKNTVEWKNAYQRCVMNLQTKSEDSLQSFVADRACDFLAYSSVYSTQTYSHNFTAIEYIRRLRSALVFLVHPHHEIKATDGRRSEYLDPETQWRLHGAIEYILESNDVPYYPITSPVIRDRARLIKTAYHHYTRDLQ